MESWFGVGHNTSYQQRNFRQKINVFDEVKAQLSKRCDFKLASQVSCHLRPSVWDLVASSGEKEYYRWIKKLLFIQLVSCYACGHVVSLPSAIKKQKQTAIRLPVWLQFAFVFANCNQTGRLNSSLCRKHFSVTLQFSLNIKFHLGKASPELIPLDVMSFLHQ